MMIIIFLAKQGILSVHSQGILAEVIGSQTEKINSSGQLSADHYCCRSLDHNSRSDIFIGNSSLIQPIGNLFDHSLDLIHLFLRADHGKHNSQISICTCPENSPQLSLEHFFAVQTKPDSSVTHDGIGLIRNIQICSLLICSQICSTDHCQPVTHSLCNLFICMKQLVLSGIILPAQILKFTSQKSNSRCSVIQYTVQVIHISDIGIYFNSHTIPGKIRFFPELQKLLSFLQICLSADFIFLLDLFVRMNIQRACITVHDGQLSVPLRICINFHQSRNIHGFCKNGSMGNIRAMMSYNGQYFLLVHLHQLCRSNTFCYNDHRFLPQIDPGRNPSQNPDKPF